MLSPLFARLARCLLAGLTVAATLLSRPAFADGEVEGPASKTLSPKVVSEEALVAASGQAVVMQGVVERALAYIGAPYRFGGSSPQGFDCSGLVNYVFRETLGVTLPRTSRQLATVGIRVARDELRAGDLVFFNTRGAPNTHVGIYLGDGRFVHAPRARTLVRIDRLDDPGYRGRFEGARRLDPLMLLIAPIQIG